MNIFTYSLLEYVKSDFMMKIVMLKLGGIALLCLLLGFAWGYRQFSRQETAAIIPADADQVEVVRGERKKICLTFDDGPHPFYTEQLLDGLKERNVKATFFVTGEHAELHPDVILRMAEEGHEIGNHTYSHMQLKSTNREAYKAELIRTSEVIEAITGNEVTYVRPPYGTWDKTLEQELDLIQVLWTVDPLDWCSDDAVCIAGSVIDKVQENDIILLHDYYESSVTAALRIVDELLEEGFTFVTVEEILFD